jgi:hypothetical protein
VQHSDEMFPIAESLASLPLMEEPAIAILADGGGHATIAADYLTELGIRLPELEKETRAKLKAILPANASLANPIDVAGGPTRTRPFLPTAPKFCSVTGTYTGFLSSASSAAMASALPGSWLSWKRMLPTAWENW